MEYFPEFSYMLSISDDRGLVNTVKRDWHEIRVDRARGRRDFSTRVTLASPRVIGNLFHSLSL